MYLQKVASKQEYKVVVGKSAILSHNKNAKFMSILEKGQGGRSMLSYMSIYIRLQFFVCQEQRKASRSYFSNPSAPNNDPINIKSCVFPPPPLHVSVMYCKKNTYVHIQGKIMCGNIIYEVLNRFVLPLCVSIYPYSSYKQ